MDILIGRCRVIDSFQSNLLTFDWLRFWSFLILLLNWKVNIPAVHFKCKKKNWNLSRSKVNTLLYKVSMTLGRSQVTLKDTLLVIWKYGKINLFFLGIGVGVVKMMNYIEDWNYIKYKLTIWIHLLGDLRYNFLSRCIVQSTIAKVRQLLFIWVVIYAREM